MIGSYIAGGLGNQMFQYAAGRALALRHRTALRLDLTSFGSSRHFETVRQFELGKLAIDVAPTTPLASLTFRLARRNNAALSRLSGWRIMREESLGHYDPQFETLPDNTYVYGYWQSWRYFNSAAEQIRAELQPRAPLSAESERRRDRMRSVNSLSLHVRRGDYLTAAGARDLHGVLDLDYYSGAVRHVQERLSDVEGFVFSDDLDWCRETFANLQLPLTFVDANHGDDSWQDIYLMAACRNCIIANSSFSWWGAWLGDGPNKPDRIVIAPRRWFAGMDVAIADRCPPNWLMTAD